MAFQVRFVLFVVLTVSELKSITTSITGTTNELRFSMQNTNYTTATTTTKTKTTIKTPTNITLNNINGIAVDTHRCSVTEQRYCHRYIKNIFVLYIGYGGWVMIGVIVFGVLLEAHLLLSSRKFSYVQYRRDDFRYFQRNNNSLRFLVIDHV